MMIYLNPIHSWKKGCQHFELIIAFAILSISTYCVETVILLCHQIFITEFDKKMPKITVIPFFTSIIPINMVDHI